jgi:dynein assembly factor 5
VTAAACRALADALASAHVLGSFDDAAVRAQCLSAAANLVDVAGRAGALKDGGASDAAAKEGASASLFRVLLQTRAAESPEGGAGETGVREAGHAGPATSTAPGALPPRERSASASAMAALARARGFERVDALYLAHARDALASALSDAEIAWDAPNPSQRAFCAFFLDAPVSVFAEAAVADKTLAVFATAGERTRDPALRAAMLRAMDAAFEEPPPEPESPNDPQTNRGGALVGGLETRAVAILETVVFESLVWRAGATEAAARYAAVVCLGTMLRRSLFASRSGKNTNASSKDASSKAPPLLISRKALGLVLKRDLVLAPVFSAMEEDYYADTRLAACYALDGILATIGVDLGDERRRAAYPEILKRMDDSRDDVRVAAARCARRFFSDACPMDWDETNCLYFLKPFVVHMDDANERVCDAALDATLAAAAVKPNAVVEALAHARETHRRVGHVERALDAARAALESR